MLNHNSASDEPGEQAEQSSKSQKGEGEGTVAETARVGVSGTETRTMPSIERVGQGKKSSPVWAQEQVDDRTSGRLPETRPWDEHAR